ncbi:hypothetical protein ULMS_22170 [Patiriisocius marinistellae]|uniref:peptidylprolyl isomerase n=1 Tax=Patiriisocius marinistellae TaxID=2494560 RepID=A0A5J4G1Z2_9FLAO|nr:hypothetical protein [Patiriisocius marinistellae]GEQ86709.1 hypothetical protein ULMS_22170 [Patiriisocius marinistellae]
MKKLKFILPVLALFSAIITSCGNDDDTTDPNFIPARDRAEELIASTAEVEGYLETHFYNYEEFASPPADFDFRIKFDTIAGDNSNKIPLMSQVDFKMVKDRVDSDVEYKLYFLKVIEGEGDRPSFPDIARITYEGTYVSDEDDSIKNKLFDSSVSPLRFDMTQIVNGLQDALIEFKAATSFSTNPDGTVAYEGYGVGAVFMQSGLGYYVNPPPTTTGGVPIPVYSQLIFSFQLLETEVGDQDNDGIPSVMEDINENGLEEDDNTDGDTLPNYADADDDGDGRPTEDEIIINEDGSITFPDTDGDGTPDHLDADS